MTSDGWANSKRHLGCNARAMADVWLWASVTSQEDQWEAIWWPPPTQFLYLCILFFCICVFCICVFCICVFVYFVFVSIVASEQWPAGNSSGKQFGQPPTQSRGLLPASTHLSLDLEHLKTTCWPLCKHISMLPMALAQQLPDYLKILLDIYDQFKKLSDRVSWWRTVGTFKQTGTLGKKVRK